MTLTPVPAPQAAAPPHSLVRSAITNRDGDAGGDWTRGLTYMPETCGGYRAISDCTAEEVDHGALEAPPDLVEYRPWDLLVEDPCVTTFGYSEEVVTARLRRAADAIESFAIARELFAGDLTKAEVTATGGTPNLHLTASPVVLGSGPVSPRRGLGLIEQAIGEALHGQQAFIHLSREALPLLWGNLSKVGQLLYTAVDNVAVADAGYPGGPPDGTAPAANVEWIYATGPVVVRRTPFVMDSVDEAQVIDTRTNTIRRTGTKRVAATFDTCALFAVPITLS